MDEACCQRVVDRPENKRAIAQRSTGMDFSKSLFASPAGTTMCRSNRRQIRHDCYIRRSPARKPSQLDEVC